MSEQHQPPPAGHEDIDPAIHDAVRQVVNRFGAPGLEDLIRLARDELADAQAELDKLADPEA